MGAGLEVGLGEGRPSFSEEKEAKRLLSGWGARWCPAVRTKGVDVFWFFFSKKNILACDP
jgi:hypothetical protein